MAPRTSKSAVAGGAPSLYSNPAAAVSRIGDDDMVMDETANKPATGGGPRETEGSVASSNGISRRPPRAGEQVRQRFTRYQLRDPEGEATQPRMRFVNARNGREFSTSTNASAISPDSTPPHLRELPSPRRKPLPPALCQNKTLEQRVLRQDQIAGRHVSFRSETRVNLVERDPVETRKGCMKPSSLMLNESTSGEPRKDLLARELYGALDEGLEPVHSCVYFAGYLPRAASPYFNRERDKRHEEEDALEMDALEMDASPAPDAPTEAPQSMEVSDQPQTIADQPQTDGAEEPKDTLRRSGGKSRRKRFNIWKLFCCGFGSG